MALMVSTDLIDSQSRVEALASAMSRTEVPIDVTVSGPAHNIWHRLEAWELQPGFHVLRNVGTAFRVRRGPVQLKVAAPERVAIAFQMGTEARYESVAGFQLLRKSDMQLVDQTTAMDYSISGIGGSTAAVFDYDTLGVSVDTARKAIGTLRRSPLYDLVRNDLSRLCETLDGLESQTAVDLVASAMKGLVAALVVTASGDDSTESAGAMEHTLVSRAKAYIEEHIRDQALTPGEVAAAQHVTVRHLRDAWPHDEPPVGQYITECRLRHIEAELLAKPGSIAVADLQHLSLSWGFASLAEFEAEFQNTYGKKAID
jgi:AraC-like DNA-binding protein